MRKKFGIIKSLMISTNMERVLARPLQEVYIPARKNLRALVKSERKITLRRETDVFWKENLVSCEEDNNFTFAFETKYCELDEVLSISHLNQIPSYLTKKFLKEVPERISNLAHELVGKKR